MGSPKTRGRAVFVIGLFAERPSATRHPALTRWGDLRRRGEPGCDRVHATLAQSVSGMGVAFVESGRLRPAVERPTIRIDGLASGCRIPKRSRKSDESDENHVALRRPTQDADIAGQRRAMRARTAIVRGWATHTNVGEVVRWTVPSGSRWSSKSACGSAAASVSGRASGAGCCDIRSDCPSASRSIKARWKSAGRNAQGLRGDRLSADAFEPQVAIDRVTPVDPRCRRSGVEKQHSRFMWDGRNSCPAIHHVPLLAFEGNFRSEKLPLVFQGEVFSTQNGVRFRLL